MYTIRTKNVHVKRSFLRNAPSWCMRHEGEYTEILVPVCTVSILRVDSYIPHLVISFKQYPELTRLETISEFYAS
jgi:hypothetical protein